MFHLRGDRYFLIALRRRRFRQLALIRNDFRLIAGPAEIQIAHRILGKPEIAGQIVLIAEMERIQHSFRIETVKLRLDLLGGPGLVDNLEILERAFRLRVVVDQTFAKDQLVCPQLFHLLGPLPDAVSSPLRYNVTVLPSWVSTIWL